MFLYKLLRKSWPFWKKQLVLQNDLEYWVTTEKSYHSLPHWMVFMQIFTLQIDKQSAFAFLFNGKYGKSFKWT